MVRKLGAPSHEEFAVGAIAEGVRVVNAGRRARARYVTPEQLAFVEELERVELHRRTRLFAAIARRPVAGRIAIVVDDGVATGATAMAACRALRARGADARSCSPFRSRRPSGSPDAGAVDEFVCPHRDARLLGGRPVLRRLHPDERRGGRATAVAATSAPTD